MTLRKVLFWTHLVVGLGAGILILSTCVSGVMLAFEPQIVEFAERNVRFVSPANGSVAGPPQRPDAETLLARAAQTTDKAVPTAYTWSADPSASVSVRLGREGTLFLNPYSGAILGKESKVHGALHEVEDWHRWLWNRDAGKPITGAGAFAFLGLALSGVYLWWPRIGTSYKTASTLKLNLKGKARDWNWHTVLGFWISLYIVLLASTGIIMSYTWATNLVYRATGNTPPPPPQQRASPPNPSPGGRGAHIIRGEAAFKGLNLLVSRAEQQMSGWKSINARLPEKPDAPITFTITHAGIGFAGARSQLTLNRKTGEIEKWEAYAEANAGRKARTWATRLHTGQALGWFGQMLNLFAALTGLILIWTGFALAWRRFSKMLSDGRTKKEKKRL